MKAVVTGVVSDVARTTTPDDPDEACRELRRLVKALSQRVAEATEAAGFDGRAARDVGCILGTEFGTSQVAEHILATLRDRDLRFLDPEAFILFAPQGVTSSIGLHAALGGMSATLTGADAGSSAVVAATRTVAGGRHCAMWCGGFDWPTRLSMTVGGANHGPPRSGGAALLLIESADHASSRHAPILGTVQLDARSGSTDEVASEFTHALGPVMRAVSALSAGNGSVSLADATGTVAIEASGVAA